MKKHFLNQRIFFCLALLVLGYFSFYSKLVRAAEQGCSFDNPEVKWNLISEQAMPLFKRPFYLKVICDSQDIQWRLSIQPLALSIGNQNVYAVVYDGQIAVTDVQPIQGSGSRDLNLTLYLGQAQSLEAAKAGSQFIFPVQRAGSVSFNLVLKLDW